jgi:hypothetical protein
MADHQQFKSGTPKEKGYYDCLVDDQEEMRLYFFICSLNPRKRYWVLPDGSQISSDEVKYKPK